MPASWATAVPRRYDPRRSAPIMPNRTPALLVPAVGVALLTVLALAGYLGPYLSADDLAVDDAGQHVWWAQRAWDADLVAHSELARYFASDAASPLAWRPLIVGLGHVGEIQAVAEWANVAVVGLTVVAVYALGRRTAAAGGFGPEAAAWGGLAAAAGFLLTRPQLLLYETILLQRSFATGIAAVALWSLLAGRLLWLGVAFLAAALLYPVLVPVLGLVAVVHEMPRLVRDRRPPPGWLWPTAGGLLAIALVLLVRDVPDAYGTMIDGETARGMPIFGNDGRSAVFLDKLHVRLLKHGRTGLGVNDRGLLVAGLTLAAALVLAGTRRVPRLAWVTAGVSLALFAAAHLTLFRLYLPNRHVHATLPLAWAMLLALAAAAGAERYAALARRRALPTGPAARTAAIALLLIASAAYMAPEVSRVRGKIGRNAADAAHAAVRRLPPDAVVAGMPEDVDLIGLRTGRAPLITRETTQAYYPGYYRQTVLPRLRDAIAARYADDWATVDRLHERYGVTVWWHVAEDPTDLPREEPFRSLARRAHDDLEGRPPVLDRPPPGRVLLRDGRVTLIRVGPGKQMGDTGPEPKSVSRCESTAYDEQAEAGDAKYDAAGQSTPAQVAAELAAVVAAWPLLDPADRRRIVALARRVSGL